MNNWKEPGDGEYTRVLADGSVAKVFKQTLLWRAAVDDRMVDDIFFDALKQCRRLMNGIKVTANLPSTPSNAVGLVTTARGTHAGRSAAN